MAALLPARFRVDPYLLALIGAVVIASLLPARGVGESILHVVVYIAIAGLFFLYGARLSPQAIMAGVTHWRLQLLVLMSTYVVFPILGLILIAIGGRWMGPSLSMGLMFVCVLPSTVQSSIAFTSIARGNVPAALCCASISNLLGVVVTPLLTALLLQGGGGFSLDALKDICLQLLVPFALGQALRPWIGGWIVQHKGITSIFDRGSILLVVYEAFGAGVVAGIWQRVDLASLGILAVFDLVLLAIVLVLTTVASRKFGFSKEDEISIVFCGSKKSMASGIPMANILFPSQTVGLAVLPLMLFHQAQLFACAIIAQRYAARPLKPAAVAPVAAAQTQP